MKIVKALVITAAIAVVFLIVVYAYSMLTVPRM